MVLVIDPFHFPGKLIPPACEGSLHSCFQTCVNTNVSCLYTAQHKVRVHKSHIRQLGGDNGVSMLNHCDFHLLKVGMAIIVEGDPQDITNKT